MSVPSKSNTNAMCAGAAAGRAAVRAGCRLGPAARRAGICAGVAEADRCFADARRHRGEFFRQRPASMQGRQPERRWRWLYR